jgi:ABC-type multidrug transport system ATPase subunit
MTDKDIHLEMEPRKDSASHLQRQLSVPEASIALKWSNLTAVAPASFSWRQRLCGTEDAPRPKDKVILQNVSGNVKPGQLIAIMGASGAGKSTLLNVLARQNTNRLIVSGDVLVNGKDIGNRIKDISAYVQQEDIFIGTLTVKEHLTFQAMLRMEASFSTAQKLKRVNLVLEDVNVFGPCYDLSPKS